MTEEYKYTLCSLPHVGCAVVPACVCVRVRACV